MKEFTFLVDDNNEAECLESIAIDLGSSRINREGWTSEYGGTGILMFIETNIYKKDWNDIIGGFNTVQILKTKKIK